MQALTLQQLITDALELILHARLLLYTKPELFNEPAADVIQSIMTRVQHAEIYQTPAALCKGSTKLYVRCR